MTAISLGNVDIGYGGQRVVEAVTFDVARGESFALVGESGSGKSTVLKALVGLAPEWSGKMSVLGRSCVHRPDRDLARRCQMVFQDPYGSLHPRKTVDAVLSEPLTIHGIGGQDARVERALSDVGLDRRFR